MAQLNGIIEGTNIKWRTVDGKLELLDMLDRSILSVEPKTLEVITARAVSGGSILHQSRLILNDAQIRDLPTTPRVLIVATETPDYGGDLLTIPIFVSGVVYQSNYVVAYNDVDPDALLKLYLGSDLGSVEWTTGGPSAGALQGGDFLVPFLPATFVTNARNGVQLGSTGIALSGNFYDNAVVVTIDNNGAGNLTGGHADNKIIVTASYHILNLATGLFE